MLDMNFVRENPDAVKEALAKGGVGTGVCGRFFGAGQTAPRSYFKR